MSHPELVFPVGEAGEAAALMGADGLLHPEPVASAPGCWPAPDRHYSVSPVLTAWAARLHG